MKVRDLLKTMLPTQLVKINKKGNTGSDPLESGRVSELLKNSIYLDCNVEEGGVYRCAIDTSYIAIHILDKPNKIHINVYDTTTIKGFKRTMDTIFSDLENMGFKEDSEMSCDLVASVYNGYRICPINIKISRRD